MAQIPIYGQQVGVPHKQRVRPIQGPNVEAEMARTRGQVAAQVEQTTATFAGTLFELAANNERNDALVKARDSWSSFWGELQGDPDYTSYREKFDSFYEGLREDLQKGMRMPRARRETQTQLENLRVDWGENIRRLSDERAIEHARTIRVQAINQAIQDLDADRVVAELRESAKTMEFSESDLAQLKDTSIRQVVERQTMEFARILGAQGPLWLTSDEAREKFAVELGPDERYTMDPERLNNMAQQLVAETGNQQRAQEMADLQQRTESYKKAEQLIASGEITSADQLRDPEYGFFFYDEDYRNLENVLRKNAEDFEKDREAYTDDALKIVSDDIEAGDLQAAADRINDLLMRGYGYDLQGRLDPEIERAMAAVDRATDGGGSEWDKAVVDMELKLIGRTANLTDVETFQKQFPTEEGQKKAEQFREDVEQMQRDQAAKAKERAEAVDEGLRMDYLTHFSAVIDDPKVKPKDLYELKNWIRSNHPYDAKDKNKEGIPTSWKLQWDRQIDNKLEELQKASLGLRMQSVQSGEKILNAYFDPKIKEAQELAEGARFRKSQKWDEVWKLVEAKNGFLNEYNTRVKDAENPLGFAREMLAPLIDKGIEEAFKRKWELQPEEPMAMPSAVEVPSVLERQRAGLGPSRPQTSVTRSAVELLPYRGVVNKYTDYAKDPETGELDVFVTADGRYKIWNTSANDWGYFEWEELVEFETARKILESVR